MSAAPEASVLYLKLAFNWSEATPIAARPITPMAMPRIVRPARNLRRVTSAMDFLVRARMLELSIYRSQDWWLSAGVFALLACVEAVDDAPIQQLDAGG